jgi:hypothetical protein
VNEKFNFSIRSNINPAIKKAQNHPSASGFAHVAEKDKALDPREEFLTV